MPADQRGNSPDPRLQDAIARCTASFLIGLDARGAPLVRCLSVQAGCAAFIEAGTLAMQLPAGELAPGSLREGRVVLLVIDPAHRDHVLADGHWLEFAASAISPRVLRALGLSGVGARARAKHAGAERRIGVLDIDAVRWCTMALGHEDPAP